MRSRACFVSIVVGAAVLATTISAQISVESRFPAGRGRDALFRVCNDCHGPESVLGQLKTREEWRKTLDEMATNGAQGSDEEWNQILDYLTQHYSLIFVNNATAKELESTLDVPTDVAETIVRMRTEKGTFKTIDDLKRVPGVDAAKIDARKDRLIFSVEGTFHAQNDDPSGSGRLSRRHSRRDSPGC